jgi:hypothetical protein
VDLGHKHAFDLLLKEAWNSEQAARIYLTLPYSVSGAQSESLVTKETYRLADIFDAERMKSFFQCGFRSGNFVIVVAGWFSN